MIFFSNLFINHMDNFDTFLVFLFRRTRDINYVSGRTRFYITIAQIMKYLSKSEKKKRIKMSFLIAILHVGIIIIIKKGVNRSHQK